MTMVYSTDLIPHHNLNFHKARLSSPSSPTCFASALNPTNPLHKNPNSSKQIKALVQDSGGPFPPSSNPLHKNLNYNPQTKESRDPNTNFSPARPLDRPDHSLLLRPDPKNAGLMFREKLIYLELMGVDTQRAIRDNPKIRSTSVDSIRKVVDYLQEMGMLHKDFPRVFGMCPQVLTMNNDENLAPVFSFLIGEVKVPRKDIRKSINRCPRLLISSVKDQLRPTLYYLQKLGIPDKRFMDCSNTVLLVSSVENTFIPKLEYLQSLGFSYKDAVNMVVRAPGIFTFSIANNLQPKFDYLINEMGGSLKDLLEFPQYFAFSLEKRIKPRHRLLVEHNVSLPLPAMLKKTELDFFHTLQQRLAG